MPAFHSPRLLVALALAGLFPIGASHDGGRSSNPPAIAGEFRDIAQQQNPAVVSIIARRDQAAWSALDEQMFKMFGLAPPAPGTRKTRAAAAGFLVSAAGDILTNYHVVQGADSLSVALFGDHRKRYRAIRVGGDPLTDTAVIRLVNPPANLPTARLGDSDALDRGDWVMAIGNPYELDHTVTVGVVSCDRRPFQMYQGHWVDLIQTDASINPGSSGGPLIDGRGDVVGVNVAVLDPDMGTNTGIGFAVPINTIKAMLPQLLRGNIVHGRIGVDFQEGPLLEDEARLLGLPGSHGAIVMSVDEESTALHAGLRAGDVLVELDGHSIRDTRDAMARIASMAPGTCAPLKLYRNGIEKTLRIVIDLMPVESAADASATAADRTRGLTFAAMRPTAATRLELPAELRGARIANVAAGSLGEDADVRVDDVVLAINRQSVHDAADAKSALNAIEPEAPVFLLLWRRGTELFLELRND